MEYNNFNKDTQAAFTEAFLRSFYNTDNNTMNYKITPDLTLVVDNEGDYQEVRKYDPDFGVRSKKKVKLRKYEVFLGHFRLGSIDEEIEIAGMDLAKNYPTHKRFLITPTLTTHSSKRSILRYRKHDNFEDCVAMFIALILGDLGDKDEEGENSENAAGLMVSEPNEQKEEET